MATVQIGSKPVGSIVKIKMNGAFWEFIVIQQGTPSPMYSASCNGTWLAIKNVWVPGFSWAGYPPHNEYAASAAHNYVNTAFLDAMDTAIKNAVLQVRIPYRAGRGAYGCTVEQGERGLLCKMFLLSYHEVGGPSPTLAATDGSRLAYFDGSASRRISGDGKQWWLRSAGVTTDPNYPDDRSMGVVSGGGDMWFLPSNYDNTGIRPAFVLPFSLLVADDGTVTTNTAPIVPASISIPGSISGGSTITVSWGGAADAEGNLAGYIVERSTNGGTSWAQIYQGGGLITGDNVAFGTPSVIYRVKAYDNQGLHSGYRTSNQVTVFNNVAPGTPASITVPVAVEGGKALSVTWGAAADSDGNLAGYSLERSVAGAAYAEVYRGAALSYTDTITKGWASVTYRVRAYDAYTAYSGYTTSPTRTVNNNTAPTITCSSANNSNLGTKSAGFTLAYTVNDVDGNVVTVTEAIDGVTKRTYAAVLGASNSFAVTGDTFMKLLNGARKMTIAASDGKLTTTYTLNFTKSVTSASCTLATPMNASALITVAAISVAGVIPADTTFKVEVTNNAKETSPTWEDCTVAAKRGANHLFVNKTASKGFAFNFRVTLSRGASGASGYITSIQGGFQ